MDSFRDLHKMLIMKRFVCSDVSSKSDLNQLMLIIRNGGVFVVNRDTEHHEQS